MSKKQFICAVIKELSSIYDFNNIVTVTKILLPWPPIEIHEATKLKRGRCLMPHEACVLFTCVSFSARCFERTATLFLSLCYSLTLESHQKK